MKNIILIFVMTIALYSCEKENVQQELSSDVVGKTADNSQELNDVNKYFGVFSTFDSELHGEIRIKQEDKNHYSATIELINSEVLIFRGLRNKHSSFVDFKGNRGSFSIDFSENSNKTATSFLVDNKEGYIKTYKEPLDGGGILLGTYVDDIDSAFSGNWDMISFGIPEPNNPSFMIIDDILISHIGGQFFNDETAGLLEPFFDICLTDGTPFVGAATDGFLTFGNDQIATFGGVVTNWTMTSDPIQGFEPFTCLGLGPNIHGTWSRNGRTGTITRFF